MVTLHLFSELVHSCSVAGWYTCEQKPCCVLLIIFNFSKYAKISSTTITLRERGSSSALLTQSHSINANLSIISHFNSVIGKIWFYQHSANKLWLQLHYCTTVHLSVLAQWWTKSSTFVQWLTATSQHSQFFTTSSAVKYWLDVESNVLTELLHVVYSTAATQQRSDHVQHSHDVLHTVTM